MTGLVYYAVQHRYKFIKKWNKRFILGSFVFPAVILLPTIFYHGNGPCSHGAIFFNCVCPNRTLNYALFLINWVFPCVLLAVIAFWLMWKIRKYNVPGPLYNGIRPSMKLALLVYNIPPWNFVMFLVNLILTFLPDFES